MERKIIYQPGKYKISTLIKKRPLVFFDLEFSGLNFDNEILEIGAVLVSQPSFKIKKEFFRKIKLENSDSADPHSLKKIGYSKTKWRDAVKLKDALEDFNKFAKGGVLVGYNPVWDFSFLFKSYWKENIKILFHWQVLDVMSIAYYKLFQKLKGFRMSEVAKFLGIKNMNWHNALDDAKMTYEIFKKLIDYGRD